MHCPECNADREQLSDIFNHLRKSQRSEQYLICRCCGWAGRESQLKEVDR